MMYRIGQMEYIDQRKPSNWPPSPEAPDPSRLFVLHWWCVPNVEHAESEQALARELRTISRPRTPPPDYTCHLCHCKGHYIQNCAVSQGNEFATTPYQGKKICLGEYMCPKCKRKWISKSSRANTSQNCIKCKIAVYPKKQRPIGGFQRNITRSTSTIPPDSEEEDPYFDFAELQAFSDEEYGLPKVREYGKKG